LIDTVNYIYDQVKDGDLSLEIETALVKGIHAQLTQLDAVLVKVLPSAKALTWEKRLQGI
jgi:hypothetical protein